MRVVVMLLLLLLVAIGWVLGQLPVSNLPASETSAWRRTANGWESAEQWSRPVGQPYRLNPLLVGALQVGISLVALTAASDAKRTRRPCLTAPESASNPTPSTEFS